MDERPPIFLVRVMKIGESRRDDGRRFTSSEFHKVDLRMEHGKQVSRNCYPNLPTRHTYGAIFQVKSLQKMYVLGVMAEHQSLYDDDYQHGYGLDINNKDTSWTQFKLPIHIGYSRPRCAILDSKIYHFEFHDRLHPHLDSGPLEIVALPPEHVDASFPRGIIADPCNNRILINLYGYQLYAYHLLATPLATQFQYVGKVRSWSDVIALVDNILYVYCPEDCYLSAYDLSDMSKCLEVVWESSSNFIFECLRYKALFHVGNNNFWFTIWYPDFKGNVTLSFIKFKVKRVEDRIICTPLVLHQPLIESTWTVVGVHLLDEEDCG